MEGNTEGNRWEAEGDRRIAETRRRDDVITTQIDALRDEMRMRFESMEQVLNQRIRHGDANTQVVMDMTLKTITSLQASQQEHDVWAKAQVEQYNVRMAEVNKANEARFRAIEDKQLSWMSSARMIGVMVGGASTIAALAGTLIGSNF